MQIKFEDIKLPPKSTRQRYTSGKNTEKLEESIYKLGQLHELTLDGDMVLRAGWRRYHAIENLRKKYPDDERFNFVKVDVRKDLSDLEYFDIELEENWRRQDLTHYELGEALKKRKELYEKLHPETIQGANIVKGREKYQTKESLVKSRVGNIPKREKSKKEILRDRLDTPEGKVEPAERFTKNAADLLGVSESNIRKHIQVGKAIEEKKLDEKKVEKYKEGKIPFTKILKEIQKQNKKKEDVKREREEKRKLGLENALKGKAFDDSLEIPQEPITISYGDDVEFDSSAVSVEVPPKTPKVTWCRDCKHGRILPCPNCMSQVLACSEPGYVVLRNSGSEGCEKYA